MSSFEENWCNFVQLKTRTKNHAWGIECETYSSTVEILLKIVHFIIQLNEISK